MRSLLLLPVLLSLGCVTHPATRLPLTRERADECVDHCKTLDMKLAAVVVIMSSTGCVCQPKDAPPPTPAVSGAAAASGGAMIAAEAARQNSRTR